MRIESKNVRWQNLFRLSRFVYFTLRTFVSFLFMFMIQVQHVLDTPFNRHINFLIC